MLLCHVSLFLSLLLLFSTGSIRVVRGEGMPQYRNPFEKGDLFIKFDVQFPSSNWISPEKLTVSNKNRPSVFVVQMEIGPWSN